jgi:hypothetical protein
MVDKDIVCYLKFPENFEVDYCPAVVLFFDRGIYSVAIKKSKQNNV